MTAHSDYPYGEDLEWYAVDKDGYLARFTTGGRGPVPRAILTQAGTQRAFGKLIEKQAHASEAELIVRYSNSSDFTMCASREVFAYDWGDVHRVAAAAIRVYELIARPTVPLAAARLYEGVEKTLPVISVSFRECTQVPILDDIDWLRE